jgi:hypothetical protein
MIEAAMIFMIFFSSSASYLLALQFHLSIERAGTGKLYGPGVVISGVVLLIHVLTFMASRVAFAMLFEIVLLGTVSSFLFAAYKIAISAYFFWGHCKAYKIFKSTANHNKENENRTFQLGRRMALISTSNLISLIFVVLFATPLLNVNHGSHMLITCFMFQGLTTLLEVMAVPALKTRSQTLGRRLNSMELALSNFMQMPRKWLTGSKTVGTTTSQIDQVSTKAEEVELKKNMSISSNTV